VPSGSRRLAGGDGSCGRPRPTGAARSTAPPW
jgi:hypothetical protein